MDTYELTSPGRKLIMWCKCKGLFGKGLSIRQISREIGLDRKTFRRYVHMTREEFDASDVFRRHYIRILDPYENYIKTVFNYTQYVRTKYEIAKPNLRLKEINQGQTWPPG